MANALAREQRYYGTLFQFYRQGDDFDPQDPVTGHLINVRPLPWRFAQFANPDAYDAATNQHLHAIRNALLRVGYFDRDARPRFNIGAAVAHLNRPPADINAARAEFQQLKTRFGNRIQFVKTIGIGGFGIASIWQWKDSNGVRRGRSVLKTVLRDTTNPLNTAPQNALARERTKIIELARARHIIQRFHIQDILGAQGLALDNDPSVLVTELAKRGDLNTLLSKVGRYIFLRGDRPRRQGVRNRYILETDDQRIPKSVIWQIFDCLLTACISMAYPPRSQVGPAQNSTAGERGPFMAEQIPAPAVHVNNRNIVHFDLDPQNVFVYDSNANHREIPVFKVADFGNAQTPNETRDDPLGIGPPFSVAQRRTIWGNRILGKDGWHLPEQFTVDWDRVGIHNDPFSQAVGTNQAISIIGDPTTSAGNYGEWSNVWQIGMCLFCCMTLRLPHTPPVAVQDPQIQNIWTYGNAIESQIYRDFYGDELCALVARCLSVMPNSRPTLQGLRTSLDNLRPANITENDKSWLRGFTHLPSAPSRVPLARAFG